MKRERRGNLTEAIVERASHVKANLHARERATSREAGGARFRTHQQPRLPRRFRATVAAAVPKRRRPRRVAPLYSTPLHSTPLRSTPLHSTLLHSTPLHFTPHHSTPRLATPRYAYVTARHDPEEHDSRQSRPSALRCVDRVDDGPEGRHHFLIFFFYFFPLT